MRNAITGRRSPLAARYSLLVTHPSLLATHSFLIPHSSSLRRGGAVGEEGGGADLGHLAAGGVGAPAEVRAVARAARLTRPTAVVAADDLTAGEFLDPGEERVA